MSQEKLELYNAIQECVVKALEAMDDQAIHELSIFCTPEEEFAEQTQAA